MHTWQVTGDQTRWKSQEKAKREIEVYLPCQGVQCILKNKTTKQLESSVGTEKTKIVVNFKYLIVKIHQKGHKYRFIIY